MPHPWTARAVPRLIAGAVLALLTVLLTATPASAHDVVTGSDPAEGSTVATAPSRVSVTFNEAPDARFSTLTVVGPDGARHEQGTATTEGDVVSVGVGPLPAAGDYQIGYRIVSSDGHPVSGSLSFTLSTPSPATGAAASTGAAAAPAPTAPPSPVASSSGDDGGGPPAWPFVVLAVVVVGGAVTLVLRRRA